MPTWGRWLPLAIGFGGLLSYRPSFIGILRPRARAAHAAGALPETYVEATGATEATDGREGLYFQRHSRLAQHLFAENGALEWKTMKNWWVQCRDTTRGKKYRKNDEEKHPTWEVPDFGQALFGPFFEGAEWHAWGVCLEIGNGTRIHACNRWIILQSLCLDINYVYQLNFVGWIEPPSILNATVVVNPMFLLWHLIWSPDFCYPLYV